MSYLSPQQWITDINHYFSCVPHTLPFSQKVEEQFSRNIRKRGILLSCFVTAGLLLVEESKCCFRELQAYGSRVVQIKDFIYFIIKANKMR